jgi:uncharacterized membrane protein
MNEKVLYLGDTSLESAAAYLAGLMTSWGWSFDYVASDQSAEAWTFEPARSLYVLSDYPANRLAPTLQEKLVEQVNAGAGLLMIGGWESYHGCGGDWDVTPVAAVLPVEIGGGDDRVNCDQPALVRRVADHAAVRDLPWEDHPPCIGGYNRLAARRGAVTVLETQRFQAIRSGDVFVFEPTVCDPLLVTGTCGRGRVAALATDVAPHWVGGLVDWGPSRVSAQAPGAEAIEVGNLYAQFFRQLLSWAAGIEAGGG